MQINKYAPQSRSHTHLVIWHFLRIQNYLDFAVLAILKNITRRPT